MKIDVTRIVVAQVHTLRDNATQRYSVADMLLFFGLPFALSLVGPYFGWKFNADVLYALLEAFSIFGGLLLNLLILIFTFSSDREQPSALARVRAALIRELHDNIAYSILVSIIIVIVAMVATAYLKMHETTPGVAVFTGRWMSGVMIFLTTNFFLTVLMILKRIYVILNQTLDRPFVPKKAA